MEKRRRGGRTPKPAGNSEARGGRDSVVECLPEWHVKIVVPISEPCPAFAADGGVRSWWERLRNRAHYGKAPQGRTHSKTWRRSDARGDRDNSEMRQPTKPSSLTARLPILSPSNNRRDPRLLRGFFGLAPWRRRGLYFPIHSECKSERRQFVHPSRCPSRRACCH